MANILDAFILSLKKNNFNDILIEDICNQISISKVTFFRYFSTKEEVLDYFVLRWCYQRSLEIFNKKYIGVAGLYHVFQSTAEIPNSERIFVALINYYSKLKDKPTFKELSKYERYIISNSTDDAVDIKLYSLKEILNYYLQEIENIDKSKLNVYLDHLVTLFYGVPFHVHIDMSGESLVNAYKRHLDIIFK
jgi:AcrR family transcriptional regulator